MKMEESKTFFGTDFTDYTVKTGGIPQSVKTGLRDDHHPPSAEAGLKKRDPPFLEKPKGLAVKSVCQAMPDPCPKILFSN